MAYAPVGAMTIELRPSKSIAARERALQGCVATLSDAELLAVILGTGCEGQSVLDTARALLDFAGGLVALRRLGPHLMAMQRGLGPAKAARILAAIELHRRYAVADSTEHIRSEMRSFEHVVAWARSQLLGLDHEEVWTLALDGQNRLIQARCVARGGQHGCAIQARDILRVSLRDGASGLVVVHNHPSGDPKPSHEDITMTLSLVEACSAVGLPLLDHVIIASGGAVSLFELGVLSVNAA
jgi:DNA repair protein RadC